MFLGIRILGAKVWVVGFVALSFWGLRSLGSCSVGLGYFRELGGARLGRCKHQWAIGQGSKVIVWHMVNIPLLVLQYHCTYIP